MSYKYVNNLPPNYLRNKQPSVRNESVYMSRMATHQDTEIPDFSLIFSPTNS